MPAPDEVAEFPFLIVTPAGYAAHEMQCEVSQVGVESSADAGTTWTLAFSCSGEGDQWTTTEHWFLQRNTTAIWRWWISGRRLAKDGEAFTPCPLEAERAP